MQLEDLYEKACDEVYNRTFSEYESVVIFAKEHLQYHIKSWCKGNYVLRSGTHYEDVLQEICFHIAKKCDRFFFSTEGKKDCEGFKSWCYTVARNYFNTYFKKVKKDADDNESYIKRESKINRADSEEIEDVVERNESLEVDRNELSKVFLIVLNLKAKPHIVMTWLAVSLFMLTNNCNRSEATHMVANKFTDYRLFEMFNSITKSIKKYDWLKITTNDIAIIFTNLQKPNMDSSKITGEMLYGNFYMKKGPEMSISDWVNRVNEQILKRVDTQ